MEKKMEDKKELHDLCSAIDLKTRQIETILMIFKKANICNLTQMEFVGVISGLQEEVDLIATKANELAEKV